MLYAREFVFNGDSQWFCHLRLDSSPQYAKNYLLGELDKISFPRSLQSDLADAFLLAKEKVSCFGPMVNGHLLFFVEAYSTNCRTQTYVVSFCFKPLRFTTVSIEARMMPLQVLGKLASDTAFKTKACERMICLESDDGLVQVRLRSLMTDMGTEASLWLVPNFDQPHDKLFPFILPIADIDHGLHH